MISQLSSRLVSKSGWSAKHEIGERQNGGSLIHVSDRVLEFLGAKGLQRLFGPWLPWLDQSNENRGTNDRHKHMHLALFLGTKKPSPSMVCILLTRAHTVERAGSGPIRQQRSRKLSLFFALSHSPFGHENVNSIYPGGERPRARVECSNRTVQLLTMEQFGQSMPEIAYLPRNMLSIHMQQGSVYRPLSRQSTS